jgi:hypothetical protein
LVASQGRIPEPTPAIRCLAGLPLPPCASNLRLALLLGLLLLAFLASLLALRHFELRQSEQMLANIRQSRISLLERFIDLTGDSLRQFANDYSQWDDMVGYVNHADPAWAEVNVDLSNLTERARELGAELTVSSGPGKVFLSLSSSRCLLPCERRLSPSHSRPACGRQ